MYVRLLFVLEIWHPFESVDRWRSCYCVLDDYDCRTGDVLLESLDRRTTLW